MRQLRGVTVATFGGRTSGGIYTFHIRLHERRTTDTRQNAFVGITVTRLPVTAGKCDKYRYRDTLNRQLII